jgi:hypothetical protein
MIAVILGMLLASCASGSLAHIRQLRQDYLTESSKDESVLEKRPHWAFLLLMGAPGSIPLVISLTTVPLNRRFELLEKAA